MVKVGDTYKCDKTRLWDNKGDYLSKGQLTLLNLGPRSSSYGEKYVLVRDCKGAEGWNHIEDFITYKQGEKYSGKPDNIRRQWMTMEQLKSARAAERVEKQEEAAASSSSSKAAVPAARRPAPPPVKRSRGMFQDPNDLDFFGGPPQPRDRGLGNGFLGYSGRSTYGSRVGNSSIDPYSRRANGTASASTFLRSSPLPNTGASRASKRAADLRSNKSQDTLPVIPSSSLASTSQSKKRSADEMEEDHLKQLKKVQVEQLEMRNKMKRDQEREVKHLKLKHQETISKAKWEEAKRELDEFERER